MIITERERERNSNEVIIAKERYSNKVIIVQRKEWQESDFTTERGIARQ